MLNLGMSKCFRYSTMKKVIKKTKFIMLKINR